MSNTTSTFSFLATTLRIIAILCLIGGIVLGLANCQTSTTFSNGRFIFHERNYYLIYGSIISGVISCFVLMGLARCVQAAKVYLDSKKQIKG